MPRYRALIAYDGTSFHGWQIQPAVRTVEGELTAALAQISGGTRTIVQGASRTDAGVHAEGQVAHFDYAGPMNDWKLREGLNALSGHDVRVMHVERPLKDFHARHDAQGKRYRYDVWNDRVQHPLFSRTSTHIKGRLDMDKMRVAAQHFEGKHDFSCLRGAGCSAPSPVVVLYRVEMERVGPLIRTYVDGSAFLKYMVRTLMGTLLEVGRGCRDPDSIPDLLRERDRTKAGKTAEPRGLRLIFVRYPDFPWEDGDCWKTAAMEGDGQA